MNTDGCPAFWASDEILMFGNTLNTTNPTGRECSLLIPIWFLLTVPPTFFRGYVAYYEHWGAWLARERRNRTTPQLASSSHKRPLPIVPALSALVFGTLALFLILTSANIVSSRTGSSAILSATWFAAQQTFSVFFNLKLIHLGKKICPSHNHFHSTSTSEHELLSQTDILQRIFLAIWFLCIVGHVSAGFCVFFLSSPEAFRVEAVLILVLVLCALAAMVHQLSRVIRAVQDIADSVQKGGNAVSKEVIRAIQQMKVQRIILAVAALPLLAIVLSIAVTMNVPWWMIILLINLDTIAIWIFSKTMPDGRGGRAAAAKHVSKKVRNKNTSLKTAAVEGSPNDAVPAADVVPSNGASDGVAPSEPKPL